MVESLTPYAALRLLAPHIHPWLKTVDCPSAFIWRVSLPVPRSIKLLVTPYAGSHTWPTETASSDAERKTLSFPLPVEIVLFLTAQLFVLLPKLWELIIIILSSPAPVLNKELSIPTASATPSPISKSWKFQKSLNPDDFEETLITILSSPSPESIIESTTPYAPVKLLFPKPPKANASPTDTIFKLSFPDPRSIKLLVTPYAGSHTWPTETASSDAERKTLSFPLPVEIVLFLTAQLFVLLPKLWELIIIILSSPAPVLNKELSIPTDSATPSPISIVPHLQVLLRLELFANVLIFIVSSPAPVSTLELIMPYESEFLLFCHQFQLSLCSLTVLDSILSRSSPEPVLIYESTKP